MYLNINHDNRESVGKGWDLLAFCLKKMAPSDDFANYLEIFLRKQAPADRKQAMIISLHEILYSNEPAKAPVRPSDDPILARPVSQAFPKSPSISTTTGLANSPSMQRVPSNGYVPPPAAAPASAYAVLPPPPPPLAMPPPPAPPAGINSIIK